jgi:hypothetical protein
MSKWLQQILRFKRRAREIHRYGSADENVALLLSTFQRVCRYPHVYHDV